MNKQLKKNRNLIVRRNVLTHTTQQLIVREESTPENLSCQLHNSSFITNSRLSRNGFILVYQDIINILNRDPRKDITNYRRKSLIDYKVNFKSLN